MQHGMQQQHQKPRKNITKAMSHTINPFLYSSLVVTFAKNQSMQAEIIIQVAHLLAL